MAGGRNGTPRRRLPEGQGNRPAKQAGLATATARNSRKGDVIGSKVFVGNLTFDTTSEEIEALFVQVGEVSSVSVPTDRMSGRPRGFAFVEFVRSEDAAKAIEQLDGHELGGRRLRVNEATDRPAPGGGGGGGYGAGPSSGRAFRPAPRPPRPKGSRRNARARKRSIW